MTDKEHENDDLENLDKVDDLNDNDSSNEFLEFEEAAAELANPSEEVPYEEELEEVEGVSGEVVSFDNDEEEDSDPSPKKSRKKTAITLALIGIVGTAGIGSFLMGPGVFLPSKSDQKVHLAPKTNKEIVEQNNIDGEFSDDADGFIFDDHEVSDTKKTASKEIVIDFVEPVNTKPKPAEVKTDEVKVAKEVNVIDIKDTSESASSLKINTPDLDNINALIDNVKAVSEGQAKESQKESDRFDMLISKINRVTDLVRKNNKTKSIEKIVEVEKTIPRLGEAEKQALKVGRSRLPGYSVIATSREGDMSIVKSLKYGKERISVFFKGEKIIVAGKGVMEISSINDSGYLALIGKDYYMDETYTPFKEIKKTSKKVTSKAPVVKKENIKRQPTAQKAERKKHETKERPSNPSFVTPSKSDTAITSKISKPANFRDIAIGWKMNGVFTDGFLLESPTGQWKSKKVGDEVPNVGIIQGLDTNGDLIVGKYIIKLAKLPE